VLKIQSLLHVCSEHYANSEGEEKTETTATSSTGAGASSSSSTKGAAAAAAASTDDQSSSDSAANKKKKAKPAKPEPGSLAEPGSHQGLATIGIALLAMGEKIGMDMCLRMYNHLVRILIFLAEYFRVVEFEQSLHQVCHICFVLFSCLL